MEFLKAVLMGFAIAAPIGPINIFAIKKTLESGFKAAMYIGIGAAFAEGIYAIVATFGVKAVTGFLLDKAYFVQFFGGLFLIYLAYQEFYPQKGKELRIHDHKNLMLQVFFLNLANPVVILTFVGVFASLSSISLNPYLMVLAMFTGSILWSVVLGAVVSIIRHKIPELFMRYISYISGFILGAFGLSSVISSLFSGMLKGIF